MTTTLLPTDESVTVAWLRSVPELAGYAVATTLASEEQWSPRTDGFIQVRVSSLGVAPHEYFPSHHPRMVISCWAKPKKWANAAQVAQVVRAATYVPESARTVVIPPITDRSVVVATYPAVRVLATQTLSEPLRVVGDSAESLARYDISILVEWI